MSYKTHQSLNLTDNFNSIGDFFSFFFSFEVDEKLTINEQSHRLPYDMKWEFPRDNINLIEPIGRGAFGEVWLAKAKGILEFKSANANLSSFRQKRLRNVFKFTSYYDTVDRYENADETVVAVKTLIGRFSNYGITIYGHYGN